MSDANERSSPLRAARRSFAVAVAALLGCCGFAAMAQDEPGSPTEQLRALIGEYQRISGGGGPFTDEERLQFVGRTFRHRREIGRKLVELAKRYPGDEAAVDALAQAVWHVNSVPWPVELVGADDAAYEAFAILARDHVQSEKLGSVCERVAFGFAEQHEKFLRAVLEKTPHDEVRATALIALGRFLLGRTGRVALTIQQPGVARDFEGLYGKDYLARLRAQDQDEVVAEAEALFERAAERFVDTTIPSEARKVGDIAKAALFEIRHLSVGRTAPDIAGKDQDGKEFQLSDYRGKVVLLDFWQEY